MFQRDLWKMDLHRVPGVVGAEDMWVVCLNKVGKETDKKEMKLSSLISSFRY